MIKDDNSCKRDKAKPSGCTAAIVILLGVGIGFWNLILKFGIAFHSSTAERLTESILEILLWGLNPIGMLAYWILRGNDSLGISCGAFLIGLCFSSYIWAWLIGRWAATKE